MKKLLALLVACTAITCSFVSCGDSESESSSVSDSASVSEESSEEESSEEETTEEEEETTEEESEDSEESSDEDSAEEVEKTTHEYIEDGDPTPFLGKWECEKMVIEGEEMTDLMGIPVYAVFQLEIKDDFTAVMGESTAEMSDAEEAIVYTWGIVSETEIEIVNDLGDAMMLTLDGDYLVGTEEGFDEQIYLAKVDDFTPFDFEEFMSQFETSEGDGEWITDEEDSESDESSATEESSETASTEIAE